MAEGQEAVMEADAYEDGYCEGREVHMQEGRMTCVLGPDGEPVRYLNRFKAGFDLRPKTRRQSSELSRIRQKRQGV